MEAASSPALESAPAVTTADLSLQGPGCSGGGPLTCTAQGRPAAGVSLLSCALLASACPRGSAGSWTVSAGTLCSWACAVGFALPAAQPLLRGASAVAASELLLGAVETPAAQAVSEMLPWTSSPLPQVPPPEPPLSCSRVQPGTLQPFRELSRGVWCALPGAQVVC